VIVRVDVIRFGRVKLHDAFTGLPKERLHVMHFPPRWRALPDLAFERWLLRVHADMLPLACFIFDARVATAHDHEQRHAARQQVRERAKLIARVGLVMPVATDAIAFEMTPIFSHALTFL